MIGIGLGAAVGLDIRLGEPQLGCDLGDGARLGRLGDRSAVPALIEALADPEIDVRCEAARALGAIKDGRAAAALSGS